MPAKPSWLLRLPEILEQLQAFEPPVVDRATCERLFQLKRRRAIDLMQSFGGYRSGNVVLIDRRSLIRSLEDIAESADYVTECRRKEKLANKLADLHSARKAASIRLPVNPDVADRNLHNLPAGIVLSPGRLVVEFDGAEDMFAKLYELGQAAVHHFDDVCAAVEGVMSSAEQT